MRLSHVRGVTLVLGLVAFAASAVLGSNVLTQLGINEVRAKQDLVYALSTGFPSIGQASAKAFKAAPPAVRLELVTGAIAWAKAYTATPEFKASYAKLRDERKPAAPKYGSVEDVVKEQRAEQAKQDEDMKKMLAALPPEQRAAMEASIKEMQATLAQQRKDPEFQKMMRQVAASEYQEEKDRHDKRMAEWQANFPENPNVLLANRITSFLDVSASVDFDAKLEQKYGKMRFVDEAHEGQSAQWKLCYRAGRDTVSAARSAASAWLKELER